MPQFRGCAMFPTQVIQQTVSLKIIVFSMETPCWSPCEGLQHFSFSDVKVAEHSFQVPMPNSPLLLNDLCFGARFLQESRLSTEVFILAFW